MIKDSICKALILDDRVQVIAIKSTEMVGEAIRTHNLSPVCAAALGRTLSIAAMMATDLNGEGENLSITIKGDGPIGSIVAACDGALNVRGYVDNPQLELPLKENGKLDVSRAVGKGKITVIQDMGLKAPYVGVSDIVSGEIAEDFARYFFTSLQQPTAVALGVLIERDLSCFSAGGVIIRFMPDCPEEAVGKAEELAAKLGEISRLMKDLSARQFIVDFFGGCGIRYTDELFPKYRCKCGRQVTDRVILSMGREEAFKTLDEHGELAAICHFCNKQYRYGREQVKALFDYLGGLP